MYRYIISLSMIVLNSRDWQGIYGFPCLRKQTYNNISFKYWPCIYWYEVINTINPSKQPKHALELKLPNLKDVNCKNFICLSAYLPACLPAYQSACLTTTVDLPPKLLGVWPPFFPSTKFITICTNLSCFHGVYFHLM